MIEAVEAGVARHVTDLVRHIDVQHHVMLAPSRVDGYTDVRAFEVMEEAGASLHRTAMRRTPISPQNAVAVWRARKLIAAVEPHVVHGHASIGGAVARIAATGTAAARVYTPNGLMPHRAVLGTERVLGRLTERFIAVSESEAELVLSARLVDADRLVTIPNGIELEPPSPGQPSLRALLGIGADVPLIGSVGRLAGQKAPEVFIRACALIAAGSNASFVLIGDGPQREAVASEIQSAGLGDRLLHLPGVPGASALMAELDVFVLTSRYEAGAYAPLEAMRAGVPVVVTDVVGNRDTVLDERTGLLVAPDDPDAVAGAIRRLLDDPGLRRRLAREAGARLAARFDVLEMAERTASVYRSAAAAQGTAID